MLGSEVDLTTMNEAVAQIEQWIADPQPRLRRVVVTGFHGLWEARNHADFRRILNTADLWVPDGIAPLLVARLKRLRRVDRIPGAELMAAFFARANERGYRSFFFGDTEETLAGLREALASRYPGHQFAGAISPPFGSVSPEVDAEHVREINEARPDVLWVGLGLPKQDRWIYEHRDRLHVPVAAGVGAAFRFLSGDVERAPRWVGRMGLEWAYRLIQEPKKCWRRSLLQGPQFMMHVLWELLGIVKYDAPPKRGEDSPPPYRLDSSHS